MVAILPRRNKERVIKTTSGTTCEYYPKATPDQAQEEVTPTEEACRKEWETKAAQAHALVLIPHSPETPASLSYISALQEFRLTLSYHVRMDVFRYFGKLQAADEGGLAERMAVIRQSLVDLHLESHHTHVMWIDADIIEYAPTLIADLLFISNTDIVAPAVLVDTQDGPRFFSRSGFIEDGHAPSDEAPFFKSQDPVVILESVGSCYLVPADVYRSGAKHVATPGCTEHYSVCRFAREQGKRVLCGTQHAAKHATMSNFEACLND